MLLLAADFEPVFTLAAIFLLAIFEISCLAMIAMLSYFETRHRGWMPRLRERWAVPQPRRS